MRRLIVLTVLVFPFTVALFNLRTAGTATDLRRITNTSEETINLNPSISGDGSHIAFESTADLAQAGSGQGFHALFASLDHEPISFFEIGKSRLVTAAISQDGGSIAFSSMEDLIGLNPDRNSEIFLFEALRLRQLTNSVSSSWSARVSEGCFQPSITDDGKFVAFSSNRDLVGLNADLNQEVFLYETTTETITQLTDTSGIPGATEAKISGDGSQILFISQAGSSRDLLLCERTSGRITPLVTDAASLKLTSGRAISDDGSRVVYSLETAEHRSQVFLHDTARNTCRQITELGVRVSDVPLNPTISGDGKRIAFATRRRVIESSDGSVELYTYDVPAAQLTQLTRAPASASAEVISSLSDDGSLAVFNFPRVLSGVVSSNETLNNCEIYVAHVPARPEFFTINVLNGASKGHEPLTRNSLPRGGIVIARGNVLATETLHASQSVTGSFPFLVGGTRVTVNGVSAQILFASPTEVHFVIPNHVTTGSAEIVVTNADGFQSRSTVTIANTAPGIFTTTGDGIGEAVILNADTQLAGPFDPTGGTLRLSAFATGVRNASSVAAEIAGQPIAVESVLTSSDLPGLDEIHLLVPSDLRGAGTVSLVVEADGRQSNPVTVALSGSSLRDIVINEILADPPDGIEGDANHDGSRSASNDEFIELVNSTTRDLDLSGYVLETRGSSATLSVVRHRFPNATILSAGTALVVFGGGNPDPADPLFAGAKIFKASSGSLSLANNGGMINLADASGSTITFVVFGGSGGPPADANQSLTRAPDIAGSYALHTLAPQSGGRPYSPGTRLDGTPFLPSPAVASISIAPLSANLLPGQFQQFIARALSAAGVEIGDLLFNWESSNASVATVDMHGITRALSPGTSFISASARGVSAAPALIVVSPAPTPTPSPIPSPSVTQTPSPSASPTPTPNVVISEFRTRGPSGANDEFVELYNSGDSSVAIGGWKIKGSNNSGAVSTRANISAGTLLPARHHFLLTNSSAYSGVVSGDQTFTTGIADDGGIAVTTTADVIIDQVGMNSGSAFREGSALTPQTGSTNQSYERKPGGALGSGQDTNDNVADFQQLSPSDPQNLAGGATPGPSPSPTPAPSPSPTSIPTPTASPTPTAAPTPSTKIVISQVYGGGGNAGAPFRNDFIEIFNSGTVAVDLNGWSVQYASATSSSWLVTNLSSRLLGPGQYYLIQEASGGANGATLPTPDANGSIAMASTAGKVALVNGSAALSGDCPVGSNVIDFVGYGSSANCFRGAGPANAPSNATSISRSNNGCADTQQNAIDFVIGTPSPRNSAAGINRCEEISKGWWTDALVASLLAISSLPAYMW